MSQRKDESTTQSETTIETPSPVLPAVTIHAVAADSAELAEHAAAQRDRLDWGPAMHSLPSVWWETQGGGIKVAVLDTGVDIDHPDLGGAVVGDQDFTGDGIEDVNGHGTHVAGIIAARLNSVGFVGVAPRADLLIGKVLNNQGRGSFSAIAEGIDWAVGEGADIISMSLGGPVSDNALYRSIHTALANGRIVVCAAGNDGSLFSNSIGYPGREGGVISVGAHDRNGNPAGFSSRGGEVDLMAPGTDIWSSYRNGGYAKLSGTSMATPFVSGICALILAKHRADGNNGRIPIFNCEDMYQHLLRTTSHPGYHDNASGYGPLQAFARFGPQMTEHD